MLIIKRMTAFKKEVKKIKDKKSLDALKDVLSALIDEKPLEPKHKLNPLQGGYKGYMDCHIRPDLILIYRIDNQILWLYKIGSHSELFE